MELTLMRLLTESAVVSVENDDRLVPFGIREDSGSGRYGRESGVCASARRRGVVSRAPSMTTVLVLLVLFWSTAKSRGEYGTMETSSVGFQTSAFEDSLLLCGSEDLGLFNVWELVACCWTWGRERGGGIDRLARSTCVSVVPGSACLLFRLGSGKIVDDDKLCRG
jgi:hypothetical protein